MMEKASDTTYLNKAEFIIWKKLKLGYNLKFNTGLKKASNVSNW